LAGLIQASTKFLTTDSAMDFDFILSLAELIRHNNDYPVTIYSANIPSYPDMIGDVSYVIADDAGVAEMSRVFMEGGDISEVATN
ncbi:MAG: LytR family transcriptional regulator, partial [Eggerthellaceae bacterium]|nr:LytR family transcriptional regulator [Eggerthellaceae bacterium]